MGKYNYDESGNMVTYFVITFLALGLVPLSISSIPSTSSLGKTSHGCQCTPCLEQRARIRKREQRSILKPKLGAKALAIIVGWSIFAFLAYNASTNAVENKIYDPFEILGLRSSSNEKEIRSHYKKLSRQYHPDKVKLQDNETMEDVSARFVEFTKAYKSLTDETIRENLRKYGHPDGQQETTMGLALPPWLVEAHNNVWVLGVYGIIFGGLLPMLVGRWWFGTQRRTKDGVDARSAADFFKGIREESEFDEVVGALAHAVEFSAHGRSSASVDTLEGKVKASLGEKKWADVLKYAEAQNDAQRKKALVLLYAHLLRIPLENSALENDQAALLVQTPTLLNALLSISLARNWLLPSLSAMRLHAYLAQALPPRPVKAGPVVAQLPKISLGEDVEALGDVKGLTEVVNRLEEKGDERAADVKKALDDWGKVDVVDASFKVIDERIVTPASIVYLVVKLRLKRPTDSTTVPEEKEEDADVVKRRVRENEAKDYAFLTSKGDAEEIDTVTGWAHAPYWPTYRRPGWWIVLADDKSGRVVVPPIKISDIPYTTGAHRDYRSYKLQFQAPQGVGVYTWKLYIVSDTFVGEEVAQNIVLKIDDPSTLTAEEQGAEDEISDPEEDTLAGQMAALRGGKVKRSAAYGDDDDDDESGTDDDEESDDDSSSDSDSD